MKVKEVKNCNIIIRFNFAKLTIKVENDNKKKEK